MTVTTQRSDRSTETYSIEAAIETDRLRKVYRTGFWLDRKVESLKECTLQVYQGETFGLLGLNGAGKTTLLKTLLGIVKPTGGKGFLLGKPLGDRSTKQKIGYLPENPYFYDFLTGWELLEYTAGLFEIPKSIQKHRIPALLDLVGLARSAAQKKQLRQYSKGMVQRVGMAQALINDPELVFLDEPMSGLDPLGRKQMREIIISLGDAGKTVFFNSHVLTEVEQICNRVGILAQGELICCGTLGELLTNDDKYYYVSGRGGNREVLDRWMKNITYHDDVWSGQMQGEPQEFMATLQLLDAELLSLRQGRASLEEFFMEQMELRGIRSSS
ncbi:ABC transporter ATP-binding protein [Chamaesiphon sp. VAR_48_metabat_135_sub]|uniref:ABC transporter ATP-binding protein n=1 Tax=Chamaesiphon sp. VAR_48_metabat_135_sub TaxID=2964699 RepID=UPI00286B59C0|nr:ABC transporter ATP-binding protein [Chamaesiphon sp. VAR_48_metabat_135_sub]